ncbi:MAG: T9SS type A sorting domain-containing protein [Saprospiraceae bacterium]|nr:T9SS type A sorting domain-containing protein [Saprospiraceae bacterium]
MKQYLHLFFICIACVSYSQKYDFNWVMGYDSHLGFPNTEGIFMNFNTDTPSISYEPILLPMRTSLASISDSSGNLLFYTNGCSIANTNHEIIEDGMGLNPGEVHDIQCQTGYTAGRQSCLILPLQGTSYYYLFHKGIFYENGNPAQGGTDILYYTIIDANENGGHGKVLEKNIPIIQQNLTYGQLTATKHANGEDWWILTGGDSNNDYHIIELSSEGVEYHGIQNIGHSASYNGSRGGQSNFSPDGGKFIRYSSPDGIFIFDFNRNAGILSNFRHIPTPETTFSTGIGVSPSSQYMYVTTDIHVFQYDLNASDIGLSRIEVAEYNGYMSPFPTTFAQLQLGPDCRIYISSFATVNVLHVIQYPDLPGTACQVDQHIIQLPFNHGRALPYFPNYRLGPLVPGEPPAPPCVPVVSTVEETQLAAGALHIFPNPAHGHFTVALTAPATRLRLYDSMGRQVLVQSLAAGQPEHRIALPPGLPAGVYVAVAEGSEGVLGRGRVVILE